MPCDCGAPHDPSDRWHNIHSPSCGVFVTNRLDLQLIDRFLAQEVEKNNGILPDWLRPYDLWALQALAEQKTRQRDHQWDDDQHREESELGGHRLACDPERYSQSFATRDE